jgi:hypothetical protein
VRGGEDLRIDLRFQSIGHIKQRREQDTLPARMEMQFHFVNEQSENSLVDSAR